MATHGGRIARLSHFLHKNLLWLLLGSYALAAAWPGPGLKARGVSVGQVAFFHEQINLSLPVLTLASLLLNAGLGVQVAQLRGLALPPGGAAGRAGRQPADPDRLHPRRVAGDGRLAQRRRGAEHPRRAGPGRLDADRRLVDGLVAERRRRPGAEPRPGARLDPAQPADDAAGAARRRLHGHAATTPRTCTSWRPAGTGRSWPSA